MIQLVRTRRWTRMVGLSASELPDERLFAGDTIEYFSMVCRSVPIRRLSFDLQDSES